MSDLPMNQEDHPATNIPDATQPYHGTALSSSVVATVQAYRTLGNSIRKSLGKDPL